jgi:hypothetical protein
LSENRLNATAATTCIVTANKATWSNYPSQTSEPITFAFLP